MMAWLDDPGTVIVLVGALVGMASTLVGTFLVLRGTSMLADAISHSIVFGIIVVWLVAHVQSGPLQIFGAALTGILTVFLTQALIHSKRVKQDAAIGLVFPLLFSIGVLLLNLYAGNVHIDTHTVLLGEIGFVWLDTVTLGGVDVPQALLAMGGMTLINALFVGLFFKELKLATFDEALARALGFAPGLLFYGLLFLTSGTAVAAFDAVGAVLFVAFVIVIPASAYLLTDSVMRMLGYGMVMSIAASVAGYALAVRWDVSIGGMMAVMTGIFLLLAFLIGPRHGVVAQVLVRRGQRGLNETRTLAVHLYNHEDSHAQQEENVVKALREHLHWSDGRARQVILRGLDQGYITQVGQMLNLTATGRALAMELLNAHERGR
ncbi:metal ABC transporter permease [Larsenimonas suaedae]|uniref:Metal ABC transporter permease n=1 Tax=Larsenimonas suaedae TaxID=1851019 RepID=A0ABU1GWC5_9GAMM|nr:metal ABC transporter permease [Larsenimonas suaedae]MCM2972914.1 metal ABC transporter permease [Larsenimonas suaedae]MDR5896351.1 metal ABC transporter permease [Larsenimonas suaedae]